MAPALSNMSTDISYGVHYTPSKASLPQGLTIQQLKDRGIRYVRVQWLDLTNILRFRVIPISHFEKMLQSPRPSISMLKGSLGLFFLTLAPGFTSMGEFLYLPDVSSLRLCSYAPGHASCLGWFEEKVPVQSPNGPTLKVDLCPRATLRRVVEEAEAIAKVEFLVGFETEFILLKSTSLEAISDHQWSSSAGLFSGSIGAQVLEEIADALQASGIELQMYHAEAAPGQYEVVTGPMPPLQAADALVHTRETIYNIANKHGLRATLAPRVFMQSCGSAAHAHISVHSTSPSTSIPSSGNTPLNHLEASFLSGLLANLPALSLLALPIPASYARVGDGVWSGGTYVCWGTDNREAPVRLCNAASPHSRNFELRCLDGTANPYVALAGVLGAGVLGVKKGERLGIRACEGGRSAAEMSVGERKELGIEQRMPMSWEDARGRLRDSQAMKDVLGANFVETYLSVNEMVGKALAKPETEEATLKLLVENF